MPLSPSSPIWYWPKGSDALLGRFVTTLAMRHRLSGLSTYGLSGFGKEMSIPLMLPRVLPSYLFKNKITLLGNRGNIAGEPEITDLLV